MKRRTLILGGAGAAAAAAIGMSACTPSSTTSPGGSSSSGAASGGPRELTVWHYYSVDGQTAGLETLGSDFSANHPGVTVTNVYVPFDQLTNKIVQAAGTKSGPDVVIFNAADTYTLQQAGAITAMDSWWNSYADKAQFPDAVIQKVDGQIYGVQGFVNLIALWYNADLLKSIGVQPPTSVAELEAAMAKAKAAGKVGITLCGKPNSEGEWQSFPWLSQAGWKYESPNEAALTTGFSLVQDWTQQGYLSKEASTWDQTVPFQKWEAGNTAFAVNGNWQIASAKKSAKFSYGVVPLPVGDQGSIYLGGEALNVGAFSKNADLAQEYLKQEFFSAKGELTLLDAFGSIPARADTASDSKISGDKILSVFADVVAKNGHTSPDPAIPSKNVAKVLATVGESWSAAIAGTGTPQEVAGKLMSKLTPLLSA